MNRSVLCDEIDKQAGFDAQCLTLAHSRTIEDLSQRIHSIVETLGFSDYLFMRLERVWQADSNCGLLYSLPQELMRVYHEEHLYDVDLMIPYGKSNTQPIFSSQIYGYIDNAPFDFDLTQKNRLLIQLYKRFDFVEHIAIPMAASNDSGNVVLMLTSKGVCPEGFQVAATSVMSQCRSLCKAIDTVTTRKFRSVFIDQNDNPVAITRKPLNILKRLVSHDVTITDLAAEMCISPITAHQHIAAARKALHAKTNIGAVVKAVRAGLIHLE